MNVGIDQLKLRIIQRRARAIGVPGCNPNTKPMRPQMPNDTAAEKARSTENRDNAIAPGCHVSY
jgi:hypothetical protein